MKNLLTTFALSFIMILMAVVSYGQTLNVESLNFSSEAGEAKTFSINTCSTCPWTIISIPEWVTVDIENGVGPETITVTTVESNTSVFESRPSFVVIQLTAFDARLPISQEAATPEISTSETFVEFSEFSNQTPITFASNGDWTIENIDSWITVLNESGLSVNSGPAGETVLNIVTTENPTSEERTGTITFRSGQTKRSIHVSQLGNTRTTGIFSGSSNKMSDLKVFPNPSTGSFNVRANEIKSIAIYNELGNIIKTSNEFSPEQSFEIYQTGIYFVEIIKSNGARGVERIVIVQ